MADNIIIFNVLLLVLICILIENKLSFCWELSGLIA
ncbi:MAG: hypothetical protein IGNPGNKH_00159 [Sodalis sp. Ffu]|nr:MAG: hypothetical protein IGNPGNKH_00159 [Sodalis sp. Ffu]